MSGSLFELFRRITLGVYVVGVEHGGRRDGFTAASLMQVSFRPLLLALAVNPEHRSYALLSGSGSFAVSVLRREQMDLAAHFGAPADQVPDKFAGVAWRPNARGLPVLERALASFDCEALDFLPAGDHRLVLARVRDGLLHDIQARPLLYADSGDLDGSSALFPAAFG